MTVRSALGRAAWKRTVREARKRDGDRCVVCGSRRNLVGGHRVPPERYPGSHDDVGNVWTLCQSCNVAQGRLTDREWKLTDSYRRRVEARDRERTRYGSGVAHATVITGDYS